MKFIKKLNGENREATGDAATTASSAMPHSSTSSSSEKSMGRKGAEDITQNLEGPRRPGGGCIPVSGFDR